MSTGDDPLTDYLNKQPTYISPTDIACGGGKNVCFSWDNDIYLETKRVKSCPTDDGTFVDSPLDYQLISVPTTRDIYEFAVMPGTFAALHIGWPLCGQLTGVWAKRMYQVASTRERCRTFIKHYTWPLCACVPVLPPGTWQLGCAPINIDARALCMSENDGSLENTVKRWNNQIIRVDACIELVDQSYVDALKLWR